MSGAPNSGIFGKMLSLKDEQERVQKKTFTKWVNCYLSQLKPPVLIKDIYAEFKDGLLLLDLLELLTRKPLHKEKPKVMLRIHCITNIKTALEYMETDKKIKIVNINPSDIVDGKPSIVLGLLWTLVLFFQIEEQEEFLLHALGLDNDPNAKVKGMAKKALMAWSNNTLEDKYGLHLKDFGESWRDGKAFNALVHNINPDLVDMDALDNQSNKERLDNAFIIAENELGIPRLLDSEDVDVHKPDEKSIMTYVAQFLKSYPEGKKVGDDEVDIGAPMIIELENTAPPVLSDWDKINQFIENLNTCSNDPVMKKNYDIFASMMHEMDDVEDTLNTLKDNFQLNGASEPNLTFDSGDKNRNYSNNLNRKKDYEAFAQIMHDEPEAEAGLERIKNDPLFNEARRIKEAEEGIDKSKVTLKHWQWDLDKDLPGKLGNVIAPWLSDAEKFVTNSNIDYRSPNVEDQIENKLNNYKRIFDKKDGIVKILTDIRNHPPADIEPRRLENIQKRLDDVLDEQRKLSDLMALLDLQSKLNEEAKTLNASLDFWASPIKSRPDFERRMSDFNAATDNGNPVDNFGKKLHDLITKSAKYAKDHPNFETALDNFLKSSLENCESQNDTFPLKFGSCCDNLELMSSAWKDMDDMNSNIQDFIKRAEKSLENKDVEEQRVLTTQLSEIQDLLIDLKKKLNHDILPNCSKELVNELDCGVKNFDTNLQKVGEEMVASIEHQQHEEALQTQALQEAAINDLTTNGDEIIDGINGWFSDLNVVVKPGSYTSSDELKIVLDKLDKLNQRAPKIQDLIASGRTLVDDLKAQNAPEKAHKLQKSLDDLENKMKNTTEKDLPTKKEEVTKIIKVVEDIEKGIEELNDLADEGGVIQKSLDDVKNSDDSKNVHNNQKKFVEKEALIAKSIEKIKEYLKNLKDLSRTGHLQINTAPLEKQIALAEEDLQKILNSAKSYLTATQKCENACDGASKCLEEITKKLQSIESNPGNDDVIQKESLKSIQDLEKTLNAAEEMIDIVLKQKNEAESNLDKAEVAKINTKIMEMRNDANDLKKKLRDLKNNLGTSLETWADFNEIQTETEAKLNEVTKDLEKCLSDRNGNHGRDCEDKLSLLEDNQKRLNQLNEQRTKIDEIINLANKLNSERPLQEAKELKEKFQRQLDQLENEVKQNEKDLKDHQHFNDELSAFKYWVKEAGELSQEIESTPNTKEGLLKKQKLIDKLNSLKPDGDNRLRKLRGLEQNLLTETAPDTRQSISFEINKESSKFNNIFGDLDSSNDDINESITKLEKFDEQCAMLSGSVDDLDNELEKSLEQPKDSVADKERVAKDLVRINSMIGEKEARVKDLLKQSEGLSDDARMEMVAKLEQIADQLGKTHQHINEELSQNKSSIDKQSKLEGKLREMDSFFGTLKENILSCSESATTEKDTEEKLNKLEDMENDLLAAEDMIEEAKRQRNEAIPYLSKSELNNIDMKISNMENNVADLKNEMDESRGNLSGDLDKWNAFNENRDKAATFLDNLAKELDQSHQTRGGIHGGDFDDKESLLKENEKRLEDLLNQSEEIDMMRNLAGDLHSTLPLEEVDKLKKSYQDQIENLKKEITSNRKDLEDQKQFDDELSSFKVLVTEVQDLSKEIDDTPNTKEGLLKKQKLMEKLDELRNLGTEKLKGLKILEGNILNETAPDTKDQISAEVAEECDKFGAIFGEIDNANDAINDTISKLEKLEDMCGKLSGNIGDINEEFEAILQRPRNTVGDKEEMNEEMIRVNRSIDQQKSQIKDLLNQADGFDNDAKEEVMVKLRSLENAIGKAEETLKEELTRNQLSIDRQSKLEAGLKDLDSFIGDIEENVVKYSVLPENKDDTENSLNKIKNLERDLAETEEMIAKTMKQREEALPCLTKSEIEKIDKRIDVLQNNAEDLKKEMDNSKINLADQLNKWNSFNDIKEATNKGLDKLSKELEQSHDLRKGVHGGDYSDKALLLEENEGRLAELIERENEIVGMIVLAKDLHSDIPLREAEALLDRCQQDRKHLEKEIARNHKDLDDHKEFQEELDSFRDWIKEVEDLNKEIENTPNTKEGLLKKQKLLEQLNGLKSPGNNKLKDLKNVLNNLLAETAPDRRDQISNDVTSESARFNAVFGDIDNSKDDINETITKLEKLDEKCGLLSDNVADINNDLRRSLNQPKNSINDKEKLDKELNRLKRHVDDQKEDIEELMLQTEGLNEEAKEEMIVKLKALMDEIGRAAQGVEEEMTFNKRALGEQSKLEESLNSLDSFIGQLEDCVKKCSEPANDERGTKEKLGELQNLEKELAIAEDMITMTVKQNDESRPYLSESQQGDIDKNIDLLRHSAAEMGNQLQDARKDLGTELNKWNMFNQNKEEIKGQLGQITKELDQCHDKRKGIHGGSCEDKAALLKENQDRFIQLNEQEKEIEGMIVLAKSMNSDIPLREAEELSKLCKEQKMDLEKEISRNGKDMEDHRHYDEEMASFRDWMEESLELERQLNDTPNSKDGLLTKQKLLEKLFDLKSPGQKKIKDLKTLQQNLLTETAPDSRDRLLAELDGELENFNKIFGDIDNSNDDVTDTIRRLERLEERCEGARRSCDELQEGLENCLRQPRETIEDRDKLEKELGRYTRLIDQLRSEAVDLLKQGEALNGEACEDMIVKAEKIMKDLTEMQREVNQESVQNKSLMDQQAKLEDSLRNLDQLIDQFEDNIADCSVPGDSEKIVEENMKKLEKLKAVLPVGKTILDQIIQSRQKFDAPEHIQKTCDDREQKFFDVEEVITKLEKNLEMTKNNWTAFNSEKEELESWVDSVNNEMAKLNDKNQGIHGGRFDEKERLLDVHRNLLQDVLNHEPEIKALIDRSTPLSMSPNTESPKRMTNSVCKKYEKLLETLTDIVKINQADLEVHDRFEKEMDQFSSENARIVKELNDQLSSQPNSKEGLQNKAELCEEIREMHNQRAKLLPELEKMKEELIEHSSPKAFKHIEQLWDKIIDNFEKVFSKTNENQTRLLATVEILEKTESNCDDIAGKLADINRQLEDCLGGPITNQGDIDTKLSTLKDLQFELKELQSPIDQISRKINELPMLKDTVERIKKAYKTTQENLGKTINRYENTNRDLQNMNANIKNLQTWLEHSRVQFREQSEIDNVDINSLKQRHGKLKQLSESANDQASAELLSTNSQLLSLGSGLATQYSQSLHRTLEAVKENIYASKFEMERDLDNLKTVIDKIERIEQIKLMSSDFLREAEEKVKKNGKSFDFEKKMAFLEELTNLRESMYESAERFDNMKVLNNDLWDNDLSYKRLTLDSLGIDDVLCRRSNLEKRLNDLIGEISDMCKNHSELFEEIASGERWLEFNTKKLDEFVSSSNPIDLESCLENLSEFLVDINKEGQERKNNVTKDFRNIMKTLEEKEAENIKRRIDRLESDLNDLIVKSKEKRVDLTRKLSNVKDSEEMFKSSKRWFEDKEEDLKYFVENTAGLKEKINRSNEIHLIKEDAAVKAKEINDFLLMDENIDQERRKELKAVIDNVTSHLCKALEKAEKHKDCHQRYVNEFETLNGEMLSANQILKREIDSINLCQDENHNRVEQIVGDVIEPISSKLEVLNELCDEVKGQTSSVGQISLNEDMDSLMNLLSEIMKNSEVLKDKETNFRELNLKFENSARSLLDWLDKTESNQKDLSELQTDLSEKSIAKETLLSSVLPALNIKQGEIDEFKELCYDYLGKVSDRKKGKLSNDIFYRFSELIRNSETLTKKLQKAHEDHDLFEHNYKLTTDYLHDINEDLQQKLAIINDRKSTFEQVSMVAAKLNCDEMQREDIIQSVQNLDNKAHTSMELTNRNGRENIRKMMKEMNSLCNDVMKNMSNARSNVDASLGRYASRNGVINRVEQSVAITTDKLNDLNVAELDFERKNASITWIGECKKELDIQKRNLVGLEREPLNIDTEQRLNDVRQKLEECLEGLSARQNETGEQISDMRRHQDTVDSTRQWLEKVRKEFDCLLKPFNGWNDMETKMALIRKFAAEKIDEESKSKVDIICESIEEQKKILPSYAFETLNNEWGDIVDNIERFCEKVRNVVSINEDVSGRFVDINERGSEFERWLEKSRQIARINSQDENELEDLLQQLTEITGGCKNDEIKSLLESLHGISSDENVSQFSLLRIELSSKISQLKHQFNELTETCEKIYIEVRGLLQDRKSFLEKVGIFNDWLVSIKVQVINFDRNKMRSREDFEPIKTSLRQGQGLLDDVNEFVICSGLLKKNFAINNELSVCQDSFENVKADVDQLFGELSSRLLVIDGFDRLAGNLERWLKHVYTYVDRYSTVELQKTYSHRQLDMQNMEAFQKEVEEKRQSFYQLKDYQESDLEEISKRAVDLCKEFKKLNDTVENILKVTKMSLSGKEELKKALSDYLESLSQAKTDFDNTKERFEECNCDMDCAKLSDLRLEINEKLLSFNSNVLHSQLQEVQDYGTMVHKSGYDTDNVAITQKERSEVEFEKVKQNWQELSNKVNESFTMADNFQKSIAKFKNWLETSKQWYERLGENDEHVYECGETIQIRNNLQILLDDIAGHKVDLSRLQTQIEPLTKSTRNNSLKNSVDELTDAYVELHDQCQGSIDRYDRLGKLMNKYEHSRATALHWIDANTQVLLKCSDYSMNNSQIRSKLIMIENLEKDLELSGQPKFIETIQNGEELASDLSGMGRNVVERQVNDLKSDWAEMCRQLNNLSTNLKTTTSKSELFKEAVSKLSIWLDDMEHAGMADSMAVDHQCQRPVDSISKNAQCDRVKTLLAEVERHRPELEQLQCMATDMANPAFDLENSQMQTRFNKLLNHLKEKVDNLEKQEADFEKVKQDIENAEKWIFQTSMQIINENAGQIDQVSGSEDNINSVLVQSNDIIQSVLDKEPEIIKVHQAALTLLDICGSQPSVRATEFKEDAEKMKCSFNNLKTTAMNKKAHLLDSCDKWTNYQKLLEAAKDFLDNDLQNWWLENDKPSSETPYSNKDKENEMRDIAEIEQKIIAMKRNVQNAAQECDGIPPKITSALSRAQTPLFQHNRLPSIQSPILRSSSGTPNGRRSRNQSLLDLEQSIKPKAIFEELEDNLTKLSRKKKELQDKYADWNNFNREKSAFKNWFDNVAMKYKSTLKSSPKTSNIDSFQKSKIKNIQDEINSKKPTLENLMTRFSELLKDKPYSVDPVLKDVSQELGQMEKEIFKLLNREDKQVEADFTEDDSVADILQEVMVPKLALGTNRMQSPNGFKSPDNLNNFTQTFPTRHDSNFSKNVSANFGCQTPSTKMTQTPFEDPGTDTTEYSKQSSRSSKRDQLSSIAHKINEIRNELDKSKPTSYRRSSPTALSSRRTRTPNQESVRRNMIPSPSRSHHSRELSRPDYLNGQVPYPSNIELEYSVPISASNNSLDEFVPTKDRWHELDMFLQSTPRMSESLHRPSPNREFEVSYKPTSGHGGRKSKKSRVYEELQRLTKDTQDLRSMDQRLKKQ